MKTILFLLFLSVSAFSAEEFAVFVSPDKTMRGPFTSPIVKPAADEQRIVLTSDQLDALNALRRANPGAGIAFDGTSFSLSAAEVAKRQAVTDRDALAAKLEAGTITAAEQRALIKAILSRIQKLELR